MEFLNKLGNNKDTPLTDLYKTLTSNEGKDVSINVKKLIGDFDFAKAFVENIPDVAEQYAYLLNTSRYQMGKPDIDPAYVLYFRRTLPSHTPKPEEHWTDEYIQVRNGLRREIPDGAHRYHTIIVCDTLEHIKTNGEKSGDTMAYTDNEIVVNFPEYNQKSALFTYKLAEDQSALDKYLQEQGALDIAKTLEREKEKARNKISIVLSQSQKMDDLSEDIF